MSPTVQSIIALAIVALVVAGFIVRAVRRRHQPGCGGDCGCPASEVKASAARVARK